MIKWDRNNRDGHPPPDYVPTDRRSAATVAVSLISSPVLVFIFCSIVLIQPGWTPYGVLSLGVLAFLIPLYFCIYFMRIRGNILSKSFAWKLLGECIGVALILGFGLLPHYGIIDNLDFGNENLVILVALATMVLSSLHLVRTITLLESLRPKWSQDHDRDYSDHSV